MSSTAPRTALTSQLTEMIVCPTTHNDWDWLVSFETYYTQGGDDSDASVETILSKVASLFADPTSNAGFAFSYAEVGFLRRHLESHPEALAQFQNAKEKFCLLGGGITSPDNQASHGEVFIRNYLTGHRFLRAVELIDQVFPVAWLPDDFGHDPQLPVLIEALGFKAIGLSRIPGSVQPSLCPKTQLANQNIRNSGLSFFWPANDGSRVLTHFMPQTYYGITNYQGSTASQMAGFLAGNNDQTPGSGSYAQWPGGTVFATQGGDWQFPDSSVTPPGLVGAYDWAAVNDATVTSGSLSIPARLGTFADYFTALMKSPGAIPTTTLYAENYWTGYFASRPQLKIDHYQAAQDLLAAEVLEALLSVYSDVGNPLDTTTLGATIGTSCGTTVETPRASLSELIFSGWQSLVPSTHHDFVTGTSMDSVALDPNANGSSPQIWDSKGQQSMLARAAGLGAQAVAQGMGLLADAVDATPNTALAEFAVLVFNPVGSDQPDTALVEMDDPSQGQVDYLVRVGKRIGVVQRSATGTLLFQVPGMRSMAYQVVYLQAQVGSATPPPLAQEVSTDYTLSNGTVSIALASTAGWAIQSLVLDGCEHVQSTSEFANRLSVWTDTGNLYQFGMEYMSGCSTGNFSQTVYVVAAEGTLIESGPLRWRFKGNLVAPSSSGSHGTPSNEDVFTTQYDLIKGDSRVRIETIGQAAKASTSVLTSFPMQTGTGGLADSLEYGTGYYWESRAPQASWPGLTFRACRDFAQLARPMGTQLEAIAAVYQNGIPAWTLDGNTLRGCLFRNTPGQQRGANGNDTATHTQAYVLDPRPETAASGTPLRRARTSTTPLAAWPVNMAVTSTAPQAAQLVSVHEADATVRVCKVNTGTTEDGALILRVQRSGSGTETLTLTLPFLGTASPRFGSPEIVSALEAPLDAAPGLTQNGPAISFQANRAVWTLKLSKN
jgi:alpha-mannosidase